MVLLTAAQIMQTRYHRAGTALALGEVWEARGKEELGMVGSVVRRSGVRGGQSTCLTVLLPITTLPPSHVCKPRWPHGAPLPRLTQVHASRAGCAAFVSDECGILSHPSLNGNFSRRCNQDRCAQSAEMTCCQACVCSCGVLRGALGRGAEGATGAEEFRQLGVQGPPQGQIREQS